MKARMAIGISGVVAVLIFGCSKKQEDPPTTPEIAAPSTPAPVVPRYLYVAAGACYSGSNTTFTNATSSNLVYRISLDTGARDFVLADYWSSPSNVGDSPVGLANADDNFIYVLIENSTTISLRRIEKIKKQPAGDRLNFCS